MLIDKIDRKVQMPSDEQVIAKWLPVIEVKDKWEKVLFNAPKVPTSKYLLVAQQLELTEQTVLAVEDNRAGDVGQYNPILIPMIRRIIPALIGPEIFGTQPLSGPTGLIFMLRATYMNDTTNEVKRANSKIITFADASGASINGPVAGESGATGVVLYKEGNVALVKITAGSFVAGEKVDWDTTYTAQDTTVSVVIDNESLYKHIFKNYSGPYSTADGELLGDDTKKVGFTILTDSVVAQTRKLQTDWKRELEDDLRAIHGMDAATLLSSLCVDENTLEMNREFIDIADAKATLGGVVTWNYATADGRWEIEKYQNLAACISRTSRAIAQSSRRGQGNFMIVSNPVLTALEMTGKLNRTGADPMGVAFVGMYDGYIRTYVDINRMENSIIMGYKGTTEVDAGVFFAPYIPLKMDQGIDPKTGQPKMFFRTRYGLKDNPDGAANYFKKIQVNGLPL